MVLSSRLIAAESLARTGAAVPFLTKDWTLLLRDDCSLIFPALRRPYSAREIWIGHRGGLADPAIADRPALSAR
jgi:hypothetical protein